MVRYEGEHFVEPSFGDGIFLKAIREASDRRGFKETSIAGVELDADAISRAFHYERCQDVQVIEGDFLGVNPFEVDGVIGNPPYVRLRNLEDSARHKALVASKSFTGKTMETSGSVWMPFVLHSMRFLRRGGRIAMVLPYDFTYVRYARPLWEALGGNFDSLKIVRTHERLFGDILQDVIILYADGFGGKTDTVRFQAFERVRDVVANAAVVDEDISLSELALADRPFLKALLGSDLQAFLDQRVAQATVPGREIVRFNIGYVSGDKEFFHPSASDIERFDLPDRSLISTLAAGRTMRGAGLWTSALADRGVEKLYLPDPARMTEGELSYTAEGVKRGVANRYKCQVREPWYVVPGVRTPDVVLSVFSERPILMVNDAELVASNSLLCGYSLGASRDVIAASWYTSLTLLQCELEVHSLGGGVMVLVPGEAGNVRLPRQVAVQGDHPTQLNALLAARRVNEAYELGDKEVLVRQLGFTAEEVDLVKQGVATLTHWRTSARFSHKD
jgi:hypothetical protein